MVGSGGRRKDKHKHTQKARAERRGVVMFMWWCSQLGVCGGGGGGGCGGSGGVLCFAVGCWLCGVWAS